mgnify:CR=1 FL=1
MEIVFMFFVAKKNVPHVDIDADMRNGLNLSSHNEIL